MEWIYRIVEGYAATAKLLQSCPTLCDPIDGSPPSLGFSMQEHWSGLPFPSPMHESESEVTQSCLTLSDPMGCSPPGSSVLGIFQARVLQWGAIAFSRCSSQRQQKWGCNATVTLSANLFSPYLPSPFFLFLFLKTLFVESVSPSVPHS